MNIHEYQAKKILAASGLPVPDGRLALNPDEAVEYAQALGGSVWVVKAQIHAGGRGKAGGVRLCRSLDEVKEAAETMLGSTLITKQTGASGKVVHQVYIEVGLDIAREFYLSLLVDREHECISIVASPDGGMDIEQVAATHPERILSHPINFTTGLQAEDVQTIATFLGLGQEHIAACTQVLESLYRAFVAHDVSLIELNPLILTSSDTLIALDAKFAADDNALYRHEDIATLRDMREEDAKEMEAAVFGLNYITLDGNIGCMVNGAGLAMATMDIIQLKGARPANFLDVGGGVTEEAVTEAFKLLFSDAHVKAVLVNIFGGIVRCDVIARGLLEAIKTHAMSAPVVMRLVGTHETEGRQLILDAKLDIHWAHDLDEAATIAASLAGGVA